MARRAEIPALAVLGPLLVLGTAAAASTPDGDPFAFFRPDVTLSANQRATLERGVPVVEVLEASGSELAVFTAIRLDDDVTADRVVAWMRNISEFRKSRYVLHARRLSFPPRLEDLDALILDEGDLADIANCQPGDCGLKLSDAEIDSLRRVKQTAGRAWKPALQAAFRELVLHRVVRYHQNGHAGLDEYHDARRPRSPALAFSELLLHSSFLLTHVPHVADSLASQPHSPARAVDDFVYWSKEQLGGKAVVNATHVRIFRPSPAGGVEVVMTGTQIFATHYLDASLGVTALVRDRRTARGYLVYVNRSDVDLFHGFWGRVARRIVSSRIEDDGPAIVRGMAARLSSGEPPGRRSFNDSDRR